MTPKIPPPGHSIGHWLPKDRSIIKKWVAAKVKQYDESEALPLDPSILKLQQVVNSNPSLKYESQAMFTQIPPAYVDDPTGKPQVRDFDTMLGLVNIIIKEGPQWYNISDPPTAMGLIGFPINAILDWPMGTNAGYIFFMDVSVNQAWHGILSTWGSFLASSASLPCLDSSKGWLSQDALQILSAKGNDGTTSYTFEQLYECNPKLPYHGFTSWDNFFTRKFRNGLRPVAYPDNNQIITNACESAPLQYSRNVKKYDTFWLKNQPYSLADMLNNDPTVDQFVGGSVYQAFLSALSYHCWHAPVSGKVVKTTIVPGTYYSESLYQGFVNPPSEGGPDPSAPNNSQPYISAVATRGIIFIQADLPAIGLMAIVFIGMAEVSSCEFTVKAGDRVTKGDPIGMFHFGGSSHCMVFGPQTTMKFTSSGNWDPNTENNSPVNSALAVVLA